MSKDDNNINDPVVTHDIKDSEVKQRAGFKNKFHLNSCTIVLCNGNLETMTSTCSALACFEEWSFFLEMEWVHAMLRWEDASSKSNYGIDHTVLMKTCDFK